MLRREVYAGRIVWNRRRFVKKPGTNDRISRERPKSEWLIVEQPDLRIVDKQLWERVQNRIALVGKMYTMVTTLDWRTEQEQARIC
jgi:hypothetical protein